MQTAPHSLFPAQLVDIASDIIPVSTGTSSTEIDVVAADQEHESIFVGECKYYDKPVPADVYFDLKKKCDSVPEFCGKHIIYGIFSKSGFEQRLLEAAKENPDLYLFDQGERIL